MSFFKAAIAVLITLSSGCAVAPAGGELPAPKGQLLASIKVVSSTYNGRVRRDTSFLFYVDSPANVVGPLLTGYEIVDGRMKETFGGDSGSANVIKAIEAVGLEPFDLQKEVDETKARLSKTGKPFLEPICVVADGADYEIKIATSKGEFALREHEPHCTIQSFASLSPRIAKLRKVMDLLAQFYGHAKFGT